MRRSRAAEADHRVGTGVLALFDQMNARGCRHAFGHDLVDAVGGFDG